MTPLLCRLCFSAAWSALALTSSWRIWRSGRTTCCPQDSLGENCNQCPECGNGLMWAFSLCKLYMESGDSPWKQWVIVVHVDEGWVSVWVISTMMVNYCLATFDKVSGVHVLNDRPYQTTSHPDWNVAYCRVTFCRGIVLLCFWHGRFQVMELRWWGLCTWPLLKCLSQSITSILRLCKDVPVPWLNP